MKGKRCAGKIVDGDALGDIGSPIVPTRLPPVESIRKVEAKRVARGIEGVHGIRRLAVDGRGANGIYGVLPRGVIADPVPKPLLLELLLAVNGPGIHPCLAAKVNSG